MAAALDELAIAIARVAQISRRGGGSTTVPLSAYADLEPGLGFADWRCEVLSLLEAS